MKTLLTLWLRIYMHIALENWNNVWCSNWLTTMRYRWTTWWLYSWLHIVNKKTLTTLLGIYFSRSIVLLQLLRQGIERTQLTPFHKSDALTVSGPISFHPESSHPTSTGCRSLCKDSLLRTGYCWWRCHWMLHISQSDEFLSVNMHILTTAIYF